MRRAKPSSYYGVLGATIGLLVIGTIMVLSASSVRAYASHGDSYYFVKRQLVAIGIGLLAMWFLSEFDYRRLRKFSAVSVIGAAALLAFVLVPGMGRSAGGASRWIPLGGFSIQPSELAKFALVLYGADVLARKKGKISDLYELFFPLGPVVLLLGGLIIAQPDLGSTFIICLAALLLVFVAGARLKHVAGLAAAGMTVTTYFILSATYRLQRMLGFLNPWADPRGKGFQIIQALLAFGSGGITGVGLGMGRQKFLYLPAAHTDFIMAIVGEELGLVGTLMILIMFGLIAYFGMRAAFRAPDLFGRLMASGMVGLVVAQAVTNMGAVTGILPVTGITLPLVSFGGSSVVPTLASLGIVLNIATRERSRKSKEKEIDEGVDLGWGHGRARVSGPRAGARPRVSPQER